MNKKFILLLFICASVILSCGLCNNKVNEIKKKITEEYVKEEMTKEGDYYEAKVVFGYYDKESMTFEVKEKFTDTEVAIQTIDARIRLPEPIETDKVRVTIYLIKDGLEYIRDRFTKDFDKEWTEFMVSIPVYDPGFFKVDFSYEDGKKFASGTFVIQEAEAEE